MTCCCWLKALKPSAKLKPGPEKPLMMAPLGWPPKSLPSKMLERLDWGVEMGLAAVLSC